ncbi:hypothetical protein DPMN_151483 [Dreissena polymorpha]|uniref:THAP-type domain-containing protein n=1 Tax=Dreissena polymorpha TaxID=45954 RepID=A0A9D4FII8_DREPO|nr:hypothetical protein DPMN_151483 [Dreissena polymorpha]
MGKDYCSIFECHNFSGRVGKFSKKVVLHKMPKDPCTRKAWVMAISRKNWFPTLYTRVCSDHFADGIGPYSVNRKKVPTENLPQRNVLPKHERKERTIVQPIPENISVTSALHLQS